MLTRNSTRNDASSLWHILLVISLVIAFYLVPYYRTVTIIMSKLLLYMYTILATTYPMSLAPDTLSGCSANGTLTVKRFAVCSDSFLTDRDYQLHYR